MWGQCICACWQGENVRKSSCALKRSTPCNCGNGQRLPPGTRTPGGTSPPPHSALCRALSSDSFGQRQTARELRGGERTTSTDSEHWLGARTRQRVRGGVRVRAVRVHGCCLVGRGQLFSARRHPTPTTQLAVCSTHFLLTAATLCPPFAATHLALRSAP